MDAIALINEHIPSLTEENDGEIDYILKVRVPNARAYDAFYRALIKEVSIFNVTSVLSMEEIKSTTALPVAPSRETA